MSSQAYYIILTTLGENKVAEAIAGGSTISLTQMAAGEGDYAPSKSQTSLVNENWRDSLSSVARDGGDPNRVIAAGVIPLGTGGWPVREVGVFDSDGDLFAIGKYPMTYKPTLAEGATTDLEIRFIMEVASEANVTILVDPAVVLATREYVDDSIAPVRRLSAGATEPSTTVAYMLWFDTANNLLKIRNAANDAWYVLPFSVVLDYVLDVLAIAEPASPAANRLRVFAKDNGGTTQLYAKDSAGLVTRLMGTGGLAFLGEVQEFAAAQNFNATTLTFSATQNWNTSTDQVTRLTLAGNVTMAAPTGQADGRWCSITFFQGAVDYTIAYNGVFKFGKAGPPDPPSGSGSKSKLVFESDGTNLYYMGRWEEA